MLLIKNVTLIIDELQKKTFWKNKQIRAKLGRKEKNPADIRLMKKKIRAPNFQPPPHPHPQSGYF